MRLVMKKKLHPFYWGLSILFLILITNWLYPVVTTAQPSPSNLRTEAQTLTRRGLEQLNQGNSVEALHSWEQSTRLYRQLEFQEGVTGSLINQSLAMQTLGLHSRACEVLTQALQLKNLICDRSRTDRQSDELQEIFAVPNTKVNVKGLQELGKTLRLMGKVESSIKVLEQALSAAKHLNSVVDETEVLLSLGNTYESTYVQARDTYNLTDDTLQQEKLVAIIQKKIQQSLTSYQQVVTNRLRDNQVEPGLKAQLNQLRLLTDLQQWLSQSTLESSDLRTLIQEQLNPLLNKLVEQRVQFSQMSPIQSVYARLNFAESLTKLSESPNYVGENLDGIALGLLQQSLKTSQLLSNQRTESYTWGALGRLAVQRQSKSVAKEHFSKALGLAQSIWAWDIAYQWQQELGRLYAKESDYSQAKSFYKSAIDSLNQVTESILSANTDFQFSFIEKVEPVYKEFMSLLLMEKNPNLTLLIQVNRSRQIAELENFLQCGKLTQFPLDELQTSDEVSVIHTIALGDRVEVIVQSPTGKLHHYPADMELLRRSASNLLTSLQSRDLFRIDERLLQTYAKELYTALLQPAQRYLPTEGVLVFVLDSTLQNIPMAILHDGTDYLLKRYKIVTSLNGVSRQPKLLEQNRMNTLIAGVSKDSPSLSDLRISEKLSPLPEVETEVKSIASVVNTSVLFNERFTQSTLQSEIHSKDFPIVHITSHGIYSSDPEQTFILAWDTLINIRQFNKLIRSGETKNTDIELLVLSACQTAKGDKRSALGIAGVAAQAGARSTVATLWLVDASSTAELMKEFYTGLKAGLPKAEALRQAQIALSNNSQYSHPYYWAPFILVGSWL